MNSAWVWVRRGIALSLVVGLLAVAGAFEGWERLGYDARSYVSARISPRPAGLPITIIAIDDRSLTEIGRWPWPRTTLATLLQKISNLSPAIVGLDIILAEPAAGDDSLAATLQPGRVVLPVYGSGGERIEPLPLFTRRSTLGHIEVQVDSDGVVRGVPARRDTYAPFGVIAARMMSGRSVSYNGTKYWLDLRPQGSTSQLSLTSLTDTVSAADIMAGTVPRGLLEGRLVFVGMGATGTAGLDAHVTTLRPLGAVPGVYIHASLAAAELLGKQMRRPSSPFVLLLTLAGGLAGGLLVALYSSRVVLGAVLVAMLYSGTVMVEHITQALWLPWIAPVLALLGTVSWAFTEKRLQLEMERLQLRRLFSRYVPQEVLPELLRRSGELGLAGVQRNITVLFVDVRGFTALAEHLPPAQVMQVLNLYLETMAASVRQHGGMVDKYLGDGLMAVFGAPIPHQDAVQAAVYCAVDMHIRVNAIVPPPSIGTLPGIGVGVHTGEAVLGNVGGKERLEYTAMGDVVNVAARLEEMAPAGTVLLSGDVVQKIWETKLQSMCKPLGMRKVRGKRQEMTVYQVECISGGKKRDVNEADAIKTDTLEAAATP